VIFKTGGNRSPLEMGRTNILRIRRGCGSIPEKDAADALGAENGKAADQGELHST